MEVRLFLVTFSAMMIVKFFTLQPRAHVRKPEDIETVQRYRMIRSGIINK
jgi:hypothetical protein